MNFNNKDLAYIMLFIILFYLNRSNKEKFAANSIESLMNNGKFIIPGDLNVTGEVTMGKSLRVTNEMKAKDVIGTQRVGFNNGRHAIYLENNNEINQYSNGKPSNLHLGYRAPVHLGYTGQDVFINKVKVDSKTVGGVGNTDMESIRNLSELANNLTKNGKLVVPGGLEIKGRLTVNGPTILNGVTKVKAKTYFYKQVAFKNQKKEGKWTYINHDNGHCSINSPFYVWYDSHLRGDVKMESKLNVLGSTTMKSKLDVLGSTTMKSKLNVSGSTKMGSNLYVADEVKSKNVIGTNIVGLNTGRNSIYLEKNNEINQYSNGKPGNLHLGYRGSSIYINKQKSLKHGDRIKIWNSGAEGYLNKTDSGSGNRPSEFHGWTYWRKKYDADSKLVIYKD